MLAQIALILGLLLILVGMIMVLLDAFSESFFWGLLVLLLVPIFGPIYAFVKWNRSQARNGFAMSLVGIVMSAVGIYGGGASSIPGLADQEIVKNLPSALPSDEPLPNEEEAASIKIEGEDDEEYDPILSTNENRFSSKEIEPLAPKEDKTVSNVARPKVQKVKLDLADIDSAIGSNVEVVFTDGTIKRGRLIASSEASISLEEQISGGMISFEHSLEKIQSILLLRDPGAVTPPPVAKKQETITEPAIEIPSAEPQIDPEAVETPNIKDPIVEEIPDVDGELEAASEEVLTEIDTAVDNENVSDTPEVKKQIPPPTE